MPITASQPSWAADWLLSRLPGAVVEEQRGVLVEALAQAAPLFIEIAPSGVKIWSGSRLLVDLPADVAVQQVRQQGKWSRADRPVSRPAVENLPAKV